jgi:hypothetical protein
VWRGDLGFELRALCFAKQALHCLTHTSSPFVALVILEMGLANYLLGLASKLDPPDLSLPGSWDYRGEPLVPGI